MYSLDPRAGSAPHRPRRRPKGGELSAEVPPGGILPEAEGGGEEGGEGGERTVFCGGRLMCYAYPAKKQYQW